MMLHDDPYREGPLLRAKAAECAELRESRTAVAPELEPLARAANSLGVCSPRAW